jgi:hypothetical protein
MDFFIVLKHFVNNKEENVLVDNKNRELELGQRVCVQVDIASPSGVLYKNQLVKISEWNDTTKKIRVTDSVGKVWWIEPSQVSCSFL